MQSKVNFILIITISLILNIAFLKQAQCIEYTQGILPLVTDQINTQTPLKPHLSYFFDQSGTLNLSEISASKYQGRFLRLSEGLPFNATGSLWLRLTLVSSKPDQQNNLEVNLGPNLPKDKSTIFTPQINSNILGSGSINWNKLELEGSPTFNLPLTGIEPTTLYIKLEGSPSPWFEPVVFPQGQEGNHNALLQLILLGIVLLSALIAFSRSIIQSNAEKVWVGIYAVLLFINIYIPTIPTANGYINVYFSPFVIAPGLALLVLSQLGMIRINTIQHAPINHFFFKLLIWIGAIIALLPLIPGLIWTANYLAFWSIFIIPLFLLALICSFNKIEYASSFLLALTPPFIGVLLGLYYFSDLQTSPLWGAYIPTTGLALSALILALLPNYSRQPNPHEKENDEVDIENLDNAYRLNLNNKTNDNDVNNTLSINSSPEQTIEPYQYEQSPQREEALPPVLDNNQSINFSNLNTENFLNRIPSEYSPYANENNQNITTSPTQTETLSLHGTAQTQLSFNKSFELNKLGDNILEELQQIKEDETNKTISPPSSFDLPINQHIQNAQPQTITPLENPILKTETPSFRTETQNISPANTNTLLTTQNFNTSSSFSEIESSLTALDYDIAPLKPTQLTHEKELDLLQTNKTDTQNYLISPAQKPIRIIHLSEDFDDIEPLSTLSSNIHAEEINNIHHIKLDDEKFESIIEPKILKQEVQNQPINILPHQIKNALSTPLNALLNNLSALSTCSLPPMAQAYINSALKNSQELLEVAKSIEANEVDKTTTPYLEKNNDSFSDHSQDSENLLKNIEDTPQLNESEHKPFDIYKMLSELHKDFLPLAQSKSLGLSWFASPRLSHRFEGDEQKLKLILTDLLESSVKASDKGNVQFSARLTPNSNDPSLITFTINDTRPFNSRYDQTNNQAELNAIKFAHALGGVFNTTTNQNNGTVVSFTAKFTPIIENNKKVTLQQEPITKTIENTENKEFVPEIIKQINNIKNEDSLSVKERDTVLIVDMASGSRKAIAKILDQYNIKNIEARFISDAVKICNEERPALIILNADLPEADIKKFINQMDTDNTNPINILALAINNEQQQRLEQIGCNGIILKPLTTSTLINAVHKLTPNLFENSFNPIIEPTEINDNNNNNNEIEEDQNTPVIKSKPSLNVSIKITPSTPKPPTPTTPVNQESEKTPATTSAILEKAPETISVTPEKAPETISATDGLTLLNSMLEHSFTPDKNSSIALNSLPVTEIRQPLIQTTPEPNLRLIQVPGLEYEGIEPELVPLLPGLIADIQEALLDATYAREKASTIDVQESVTRIAGKAQSFGLNKLEGIAACVSRAAAADDLEAVNDLMLELENTTNKHVEALNSFYNTEHNKNI